MPNVERLQREIGSCIADLQWLCDHFAQLSEEEIRRRLKESIARQRKLQAHVVESLHTFSEGYPLEKQMKVLRDDQRELLLKIVERFWFKGMLDCTKLIGRGDIAAFILRCKPARRVTSNPLLRGRLRPAAPCS